MTEREASSERAGEEASRPSSRYQRIVRWVFSLGALLLLGVLVVRAQPLVLARHLAAANLWLLGAAALINGLQVWLKAARLGGLLSPIVKVPTGLLCRYMVIGWAANVILPVRGGEVVRFAYLFSRHNLPVGTSLGIFTAEKILDGASIVLVAAFVPVLAPLPHAARLSLSLLAALTVGGYVALVIATARLKKSESAGTRWQRLLGSVARGGLAIRSPRLLSMGLLYSVGALVCEGAIVALTLAAFGVAAPPVAVPLVILFVNLALVAPNAPANLGAFEAGAVLALAVVGVPTSPAVAFALGYHLVHMVPIVVAGGVTYAFTPARS